MWVGRDSSSTLDFASVMEHAHRVRSESHKVARAYSAGNKEALIPYLAEKWGVRTTYRYEDGEIDYVSAVTRTVLAALIVERMALRKYRNLWKHVTVSIIGLAGSGKTTYSILSGIGALQLMGYSWDEAVRMASRLIFYNPKSLVEFLIELTKTRDWMPFIIIDDLGGQISKYWYMMGEKHYSHLFSILDQVKDFTGVIIGTARKEKSMPARFREISDLYVEAAEVEIQGVVMDVFKFYRGDDYERGPRWRERRLLYIDVMPPIVRMPEEIWREMIEARAETAQARLKNLKEALEVAPLAERERLRRLREKLERIDEGLEELEAEEGEAEEA